MTRDDFIATSTDTSISISTSFCFLTLSARAVMFVGWTAAEIHAWHDDLANIAQFDYYQCLCS